MMKRIYEPDLPTWPPLYVDDQENKAVVKARYTNWRSHAFGKYVECMLVLILIFMTGFAAWQELEQFETYERVMITFLICLFLAGFEVIAIQKLITPLIVEYGLSHTLKITSTSTSVRAGWKTYPRYHEEQPLTIAFRTIEDPEAIKHSYSSGTDDHMRYVYAASRRVEIVIQGSCNESLFRLSPRIGSGRTDPIIDILTDESAAHFATVCNEALTLTVQEPTTRTAQVGRDIDEM